MSGKRVLSVVEAVNVASLLFELNTGRESLLALASKAGLPRTSTSRFGLAAGHSSSLSPEDSLWLEWAAFVHAALVYALAIHAPSVVVVEYLRSTKDTLAHMAIPEEYLTDFVDSSFSLYAQPLLHNELQKCPEVFFQNYLGLALTDVSQECVALIAATMAMVLAAVTDKLEQYEFSFS